MKVESIAECSLGAFCNGFDLHKAIIGIENKQIVCPFLERSLIRQVLLYYIMVSVVITDDSGIS